MVEKYIFHFFTPFRIRVIKGQKTDMPCFQLTIFNKLVHELKDDKFTSAYDYGQGRAKCF